MPDRSPPRDVQTIRRFFLALMIVAGVFLSASQVVLAQGSLLTYGSNTLGSLTATTPLTFFTFNGNTDDLVTIQVIGISPGMVPGISLNSPSQQQLANSSTDPFGIGDGQEARLSYRLPQNGFYTILISNVNGSPGDFLLRLAGAPGTAGMDLPPDGPANADVVPDAVQVVNIPADPAASQTVNVSTQTADFGFRVGVRNPSGQEIAVLTGDSLNSATSNLPPGQGNYTLEITALTPGAQGVVTVLVVPAGGSVTPPPATDQQPAAPAATEEVAPPEGSQSTNNETQPTVCMISASGNVNLRSGPGTNYNIIGTLNAGMSLPVEGSLNGWFQVNVPGVGTAWAFSGVVNLSGPCDNLSVSQPGALPPPQTTQEVTDLTSTPTATATATATATLVQNDNNNQQQQPTTTFTSTASATPTTQTQPTLTYTPTPSATTEIRPTATYTPSYTPTTPPAAQTAPPDANFNSPLNIPLDSTASVTDFVSYPGGDTQDKVRWDISGMNSNSALSGGRARLTLAVSCFGSGTQNVTFFTGGQTYACGQTIVDREVTYDSRTGQVTITAVGGTNTYVQWVLTGTAVRVN